MASAQILDGNLVAAQVKEEIKSKLKASNLKLGLGTILVGSDPGSISYVNGKHRDCNEVGIESIRVELPETTSQLELISAISDLNCNPRCTGFIVQLPLPTNIKTTEVLAIIDPRKDADGLHPSNLGALVLGKPTVIPCTPLAIYELAVRSGIKWQGKNVVVLGRGTTVGRPLSLLLSQKGIDATVTVVHTGTKNISDFTKRAEIVISAMGQPEFLTSEMLSPGVVLFDVGITRRDSKLVGDVHPDVSKIAAAIAPMPGGVGPMTRAMLLKNLLSIAENSQ